MKRYLVMVAAMGAAIVTVQAASVTWDGTGDMDWTQPDPTSWSGATFNGGDTPTFNGLGQGTITVVSNVTPGNMTFSSGTYTITGGVINGSGQLIKSGATVVLANTNTYSGRTTINSGTLTLRGKAAVSPNTKIYMQRWTGMQLLMDDAGTVNLGNEVELNAIDTSAGVTTIYTLTVGNNGGGTTNSTLALGLVDFHGGGGNYASARIIRANGSNGYRLQVGDVDMNRNSAHVNQHQNQGFMAMSAPVTISGTVKQVDGNAGNTTANYLYLGGTNTNNIVTGTIADPDDYPANPNAVPLNIRINGGTHYGTENSHWAFSGTNTYSGGTTINNGVLIIDGGKPVSECLPDTSYVNIKSPGKLHMNQGVKEMVGALWFNGTPTNNGSWGSTLSTAEFTDDTYFSGNGKLYVGIPVPAEGTVLRIK